MELKKISILIDLIIFLLFLLMLKVNMNPFLGIRIPATLSDGDIWIKTHKKAAQFYCTGSAFHIVLLFLFNSTYLIKMLDVFFWLLFIFLLLYLIYYANTLYENKFPQKVKRKNIFKQPFLNKLFYHLSKLSPGFARMPFWI
jgi:hypothetical protein